MIAMDEVRAIVQDLIPDGTTITVVGPLVWLPGNNGEKTWHFVIVTGRGGEPDFNVDAFMPPDRERDELYLQIVNLIRKVVAERGALMFQATNEKELGDLIAASWPGERSLKLRAQCLEEYRERGIIDTPPGYVPSEISRVYELPFGYTATFAWTSGGLHAAWEPAPPRIKKARARRKFFEAYKAARGEFMTEVARLLGGGIAIIDTTEDGGIDLTNLQITLPPTEH